MKLIKDYNERELLLPHTYSHGHTHTHALHTCTHAHSHTVTGTHKVHTLFSLSLTHTHKTAYTNPITFTHRNLHYAGVGEKKRRNELCPLLAVLHYSDAKVLWMVPSTNLTSQSKIATLHSDLPYFYCVNVVWIKV